MEEKFILFNITLRILYYTLENKKKKKKNNR